MRAESPVGRSLGPYVSGIASVLRAIICERPGQNVYGYVSITGRFSRRDFDQLSDKIHQFKAPKISLTSIFPSNCFTTPAHCNKRKSEWLLARPFF
jgi:hypothetical protein